MWRGTKSYGMRKCVECGKEFESFSETKWTCSKECQNAHANRLARERREKKKEDAIHVARTAKYPNKGMEEIAEITKNDYHYGLIEAKRWLEQHGE